MWLLGLCRNIPTQSCVIMWSHWSQQNEAQKQTRNFYIKFTFNSAIQYSSKSYEFKQNTDLLKTCVNAMKNFSMLFLMKLLFGFCLDFLLSKNLDNTGE